MCASERSQAEFSALSLSATRDYSDLSARKINRRASVTKIKMGRQPRSGDIPWLAAHSILNWIGGDIYMLILFTAKSRGICRNLHPASLARNPQI